MSWLKISGAAVLMSLVAALCSTAMADAAAQIAFMQKIATIPGVKTVPALRYLIIRSGPARGEHPTRNSAVKIRYEVRYSDGKLLDNGGGKPIIFPLRGLVPAAQVVLMMMRPGDEWKVFVPPELAYGWVGKPPAGRVTIFKVELLEAANMPPPKGPVALRKMP